MSVPAGVLGEAARQTEMGEADRRTEQTGIPNRVQMYSLVVEAVDANCRAQKVDFVVVAVKASR
jgi:hypothetical protein